MALGTVVSIAAPADAQEPPSATLTYRFTLTRGGDTTGASSVDWLKSGTTSAADFAPGQLFAGTVSFTAGQTTAYIDFLVKADALTEATETIDVTLSNPVGCVIVGGLGGYAIAVDTDGSVTLTPPASATPGTHAEFEYEIADDFDQTASSAVTINVISPGAATYTNGYEQKANTYIGPDSEAMTGFPVYFDFQHPALRTQINGGSVRAQYQDVRLEDGAGNKLSHGLLFHDVVIGRIQGIYKRSRSASAWNAVEVYCGRQAGAVDEQDWAGATAGHHFFCRGDTGVDLTGNARHLTPTAVAATTLFGYPAGRFNGTTSKLELANPSAWLNGTSAFTLLLDLQHDQIAIDQGFFRVGGTSTGTDTACAMMARSDAALLADPTKLALYFAKQDTSISAVTTNCAVNGEANRIQSGKPSTFAMAWTSGAAQEFVSDDLAETEITKGVATPTGTLVVPGGPMAFGFGPRAPWAGTMGLVRMASSRRSDAWIKAEQRNRLNPLLMIAAGAFRAPGATAPPVAFPDTATANGSTPTIDISPLANDTGTGLSILSVGTPTNGAATRLNATTIRYTQTLTFSGVAYIPYTIQDSAGRQSSSVVAVTVTQATVTARADTYTVSASAMTELAVLANDDPPGLVEVDAITVQGTKGTAAPSADKTKVEYTAGAVTGADSFTYRGKIIGGSATGTATVALTITAPASFPARLYQPMHRPLVEADIEVFRIGIDTAFTNNDWSRYLLLVWPDAIFTGTCNFDNLRYKGVFEVGGHYGPIGTTDKWRNSGITKVEPALKGNGGMLQRSFANPPLAHRTPTSRVYWWCDGLLIDTCAQTGDVLGRTQSCWWGDFWKTGVVRTSDGLYVDRASDAFIQRTDILNSNYFFSEWTGSAGGGQACHSDWLQNESLCMRSLNVWMFHGQCNGQGFYVTPDQSFDTATGLPKGKAPRDGFIEMSYCHFEPMPWDPVSDKFPSITDLKYVALAQKNSTNANDTTATFTDSAGNTHNVPAAYYWGLYVGPEVYLQETADGCTGNPTQLLGKPYNTTASYTRNATARTYTWTVDKRCFDASLHDYYVLGATGGAGTGLGGMWGRAAGWLKRSASIDAPSYQMVPTAARGRSRRITTAAGLLAYLDSGL